MGTSHEFDAHSLSIRSTRKPVKESGFSLEDAIFKKMIERS